ncbi:MAG: hypothetical protein GXO73_11995 [Calditrichaeota bacterium]|nr:hypothetical protein [Calditrichota bacterium]
MASPQKVGLEAELFVQSGKILAGLRGGTNVVSVVAKRVWQAERNACLRGKKLTDSLPGVWDLGSPQSQSKGPHQAKSEEAEEKLCFEGQ